VWAFAKSCDGISKIHSEQTIYPTSTFPKSSFKFLDLLLFFPVLHYPFSISLHFPFYLPLVRRHSSDSSRRPRINLPKTTLPPLPTLTPRRIQRFIHTPHPTNLLSLQTRMRSRLSVKPRIRRRNQILCFRGGGRVSSYQKHIF
jgi:hypothetical protein